jgi:hypothetical protein
MNSQLHTCQNFTELKRLQGRQGFVDQKTWSSFSSTLANEPNPSNLKYFPPVVNMSMVCWSAFWSSHLHQSHQTGFPSEDVPSPCDIHHSEPSGVLQNLQMSMFRTSAYERKIINVRWYFQSSKNSLQVATHLVHQQTSRFKHSTD